MKIEIKAPDGVNLKGTYVSPGRPGPAVLLLHQCNMDRHAWDSLAQDLFSVDRRSRDRSLGNDLLKLHNSCSNLLFLAQTQSTGTGVSLRISNRNE